MKRRLMSSRVAVLFMIVLWICGSWVSARAAPQYVITDLGLGSAAALNNSGLAVGTTPDYRPALFDAGNIQVLPTLPGASLSRGESINDSGQVVGGSYVPSGYGAFLYSAGILQDLGVPAGANGSWALDINNRGQVVGGASGLGPGWHAFLYTDGTMTDIGTVSGGSGALATAINDVGHITGYVDTPQGLRAFIFSDGVMQNLGTPPTAPSFSSALDINDGDQIVGYAGTTAGGVHGFLYSAGSFLDLGLLGMQYANGINESGQIVGSGAEGAMLYSDGLMYTLDSLATNGEGWDLLTAFSINESGQIVGYAAFGGGTHAYLATPVAAIPEPPIGHYLLGGVFAIAALRRSKQFGSKAG